MRSAGLMSGVTANRPGCEAGAEHGVPAGLRILITLLALILDTNPTAAETSPENGALACSGAGPLPVLVEPGAGGTPDDWHGMRKTIGQQARICVRNRSTDVDAGASITLEDAARDTADLMRQHPGEWVLVGHSLGALLARRASTLAPEKVEALILIDGAIDGAFRNGDLDPMCKPGARVRYTNGGSPAAAVRAQREHRWLCHAQRATTPIEGKRPNAPAPPTLVLMRTRHLDTAWRKGQWAIAKALGTRVKAIEKAGHHIHQDRPDAVYNPILRTARRSNAQSAGR